MDWDVWSVPSASSMLFFSSWKTRTKALFSSLGIALNLPLAVWSETLFSPNIEKYPEALESTDNSHSLLRLHQIASCGGRDIVWMLLHLSPKIPFTILTPGFFWSRNLYWMLPCTFTGLGKRRCLSLPHYSGSCIHPCPLIETEGCLCRHPTQS